MLMVMMAMKIERKVLFPLPFRFILFLCITFLSFRPFLCSFLPHPFLFPRSLQASPTMSILIPSLPPTPHPLNLSHPLTLSLSTYMTTVHNTSTTHYSPLTDSNLLAFKNAMDSVSCSLTSCTPSASISSSSGSSNSPIHAFISARTHVQYVHISVLSMYFMFYFYVLLMYVYTRFIHILFMF